MGKKRPVLLFVLLAFVLSGLPAETVKIMSFNIQIFGAAKMARPEAAAILADLVSRADVIAVQEVRSRGSEPVEQFMALLPDTYRYVIGPRQGRSFIKEQYWLIYNAEKVTILKTDTWPDEHTIFERSPCAVYLKTVGAFDFILLNNHIQPRSAEKEIRALPRVTGYYQNLWNDPDVMIVGDLNADGYYFDSESLNTVFPEPEYTTIITDEYDTTLAESHNTYDRFIVTTDVITFFTGNCGVIRFDEEYDFSALTIAPRNVSDHYPIWAEFRTDTASSATPYHN